MEPTAEQLRNRELAIRSSDLTAQPQIDFTPYQEPPVFNVGALQVPDLQTNEEKGATNKAQSLSDEMLALTSGLLGESAFRAEQETAQQIPEQLKQFTELSSQLKGLQNEALAIPLQIQQEFAGRGATRAGVAPIETGRLRENAIKSLTVASQMEATRGNLALAYDLAERAVAQKFDPIKERLAVAQANLQIVKESPAFSSAEKKRALETETALRTQELLLEEQRKDEQEARERALQYSGVADALTLREMSRAKTAIEVEEIAARRGIKTIDVQKSLEELETQRARTAEIKTTISPEVITPITDTSGNVLVYGSPEYIVERLRQTSSSKTKPVASEREQLGKFGNVIAQTSNLLSSLGKTETGPVMGYLKSLNPYDFDARAVNAQVNALVPNVARGVYGEVGVLTDQDIERYLLTLPNIKSTADQNKFVALMTLTNAMRSYEQTLLNMANSNVNVSGFVDSYLNVADQVESLEAELNIGEVQTSSEDDAIFKDVVGEKQGNYFTRLWGALMGR